ncbi:MAG: PDZ domain-containing protein [Chitinispirillaceae bacterium]|nr:PDZ domain-containing protein [Chitinispirillaceae bacterium]
MRIVRRGLIGIIAAVSLLTSCDFRPLDHDRIDAWYEFAALCLDVFFIYRDQLPSDLYAYSSPQELYEAVDEPFTYFLTPSEAKDRLVDLSTQRGGIGIRRDSVANGYVIEKVYANTPGESAGLAVGDTILRAGDLSLAGLTFEESLDALQGAIGTEVVLRIKRGDDQFNIIVRRGVFMLPSVEVDSLDSLTVQITLGGFYHETVVPGGSAEEFSRMLDSTTWARYTLLDLRGNRGGYVDQCIDIVGQLVPSGTPIVRVRERQYDQSTDAGITVDTLYTTDGTGKAVDRTVYILVDGYTASASEMLVSCLMEQAGDRVTVIGTHTYGKGRGQVMIDGPDSVLAVVTCMTISPVGDSAKVYDLVGIEPDVQTDSADAFDVAMDIIGDELPAKRRIAGRHNRPGRRDADPFTSVPSAVFMRKP